MAGEVVYVSKISVERDRGPLRRVWLPAKSQPVIVGVHSEIAKHYKVDPAAVEPHATTLDYLVAAAAG